MPFFSSKFSPKKTPPRKHNPNNENIEELFDENHSINLKLGDNEINFDNGEWMPENGGSKDVSHKSTQKLRNRIQELQEENNLLKLKYEILLNMLTQTTTENHSLQKEIERLRCN